MISFPDFLTLCERRKSQHEFSPESTLERNEIIDLLNAAHLAPSVGNTQPWHFHIVTNPEMLKKLIDATWYGNFLPNGTLIVVTCDAKAKPTYKAEGILWEPVQMEYSCAIAMEHILLGATAKGLGSTWVSLHNGPVHEHLQLSKDHTVVGGVLLGKLATSGDNAAHAHARKPIEELYTWHE